MNTCLARLQASLEDGTRRANKKKNEHKPLFLSDMSVKAQLRYRPDDSENVEYLQYQL